MPRKGPHHYTAYDRAHRHETDERVEARRFMEKKIGHKIPAGIDVDHKLALRGGGSNAPTNLRLRSAHANRGDKTFYN
jgi:hypothetical protein